MMDRREALLLVERLKRRMRDPEVLTLCEYVHGTDVHRTIPAFRRPDVPWTQPVEMIAPHRGNRSKPATQDRRRLSRYMRRWLLHPFFPSLQWHPPILIP